MNAIFGLVSDSLSEIVEIAMIEIFINPRQDNAQILYDYACGSY